MRWNKERWIVRPLLNRRYNTDSSRNGRHFQRPRRQCYEHSLRLGDGAKDLQVNRTAVVFAVVFQLEPVVAVLRMRPNEVRMHDHRSTNLAGAMNMHLRANDQPECQSQARDDGGDPHPTKF